VFAGRSSSKWARAVPNVRCLDSSRAPVPRPAEVRSLDVRAAVAGKQAGGVVLVESERVRRVSERALPARLENTTVCLGLVRVLQDIIIHKERSSM